MKKLLMITAIFLLGIGGITAQSAWEVKVDWGFATSSTCDEYPSAYGYVVGLTIYDAANGNTIVCDSEINYESSGSTSSTFTSSQVGVYDYCNTYHDNTPSFTVIAVVRMYDLSTQEQFCVSKNYLQAGFTCNHFSSGSVNPQVVFE